MKRLIATAALGLALAASLVGAEGPPPSAAMEGLFDNGRSFSTPSRRVALRCLDVDGLLGLSDARRAQVLDKAAAAGFNAVSFEAPLFGAQGLCRKLGAFDPSAAQAFTRALEACDLRRLYAFPVLYPPSGVDGLIGTATARAVFFAGRHAWGWQCWALRQTAALTVRGLPLTRAPVVGGWILYRGPWPGGPPMGESATAAVAQGAEAKDAAEQDAAAQDGQRLRAWTASTVRYARRLGFRQELGVGLWARDDLGGGQADQALDASIAGPPPVAASAAVNFSPEDLNRQSQDLDVLPPVAGAEAQGVDDSAVVPAAPMNPWDLEGLDWGAVDALVTGLPMAGQLNFLEFTLDTEDWYGVGTRLAASADKAEVPVLWRQDWRSASRYERGKHLTPPPPLAGLEGPWPDDDWPIAGAALWPADDGYGPGTAPFRVQSLGLKRGPDGLVLTVRLSRAAELSAQWGSGLPLGSEAAAEDVTQLERRVELTGVRPGSWFLLRLKAVSPRFGTCLLRTRWVRAPL
jgi:hypothetical protein